MVFAGARRRLWPPCALVSPAGVVEALLGAHVVAANLPGHLKLLQMNPEENLSEGDAWVVEIGWGDDGR